VGRTYKTEAVVLRSFRFGEADRVLHLYTLDRGRRRSAAGGGKTKSRFGARLEPLTSSVPSRIRRAAHRHGASLIDPHRPAREDAYRLSVGLIGAEAMLRLFVEQERNERAFEALTRFLTVLDGIPAGSRGRGALDPLAIGFQLKLLWLSGYHPHPDGCVQCGATEGLVGYLPSAGGAVCSACAPTETVGLTPEGFRALRALVFSPLAEAHELGLGERAVRDALAVVVASYEFHGGFRLRTLSA
jgi:DNA repair protein RecO (recombination protein O)